MIITVLLCISIFLFVLVMLGMVIRIYSHRRHFEDRAIKHTSNIVKVPKLSKHITWRVLVLIITLIVTLAFGITFGYILDLNLYGISDFSAVCVDLLLGFLGILIWGSIILFFYLILSVCLNIIRFVLTVYSWCFGSDFHQAWRNWSAIFLMDNQPNLGLHHKHYFMK